MPETAKLTPIQKQILLFLGTGGPAYISTGSKSTRCGYVTGGDRWVSTNSATLYFLEAYRLIVQDVPGRQKPWRANREHPLVSKLLEG